MQDSRPPDVVDKDLGEHGEGPHAVNARLNLQPLHRNRKRIGIAQPVRSRFHLRQQPAIRRKRHRHFVQAAVGAQARAAQHR